MQFIISILVAVVFVFLFHKPLKRYPWVFYVIAIVFDVLYLCTWNFPIWRPLWSFLSLFMQKCTLSVALLSVVMYVGVFSSSSKIKAALLPIRAELSIFAALLAIGHIAAYFGSYAARILGGLDGMRTNLAIALFISIVLVVLLAMLTITSFTAVRRRMVPSHWKALQKFAYLFYGLIYVHLMLFLVPNAINGVQNIIISVIVYTLVFGCYAVLRVRRALANRKSFQQKEIPLSNGQICG